VDIILLLAKVLVGIVVVGMGLEAMRKLWWLQPREGTATNIEKVTSANGTKLTLVDVATGTWYGTFHCALPSHHVDLMDGDVIRVWTDGSVAYTRYTLLPKKQANGSTMYRTNYTKQRLVHRLVPISPVPRPLSKLMFKD
jgi:hypothetical protein